MGARPALRTADEATTRPPSADGLNGLRVWRRLHVRLTVIYGGLTLLSIMVLGISTYQSNVQRELDGIRHHLLATADSLAVSIEGDSLLPSSPLEPARTQATRLSERFSDVLLRHRDIASIYLLEPTRNPTELRFLVDVVRRGAIGQPGEAYDASNVPLMLKGFRKPVVEQSPTRDRFGLTISGYAPVKNRAGESVAVLGVDVNASRLDQIHREVLRDVVLSFGVTILLLAWVASIVGRNLREPLSRIMDATTAISGGELETRIGLNRSDELGLMSRHIDWMAGQLQEREFIHDVFGRFLSSGIAAEVLRQGSQLKLGGEERVVSVLFMDLRGYSTISEQLSPQQVVHILNIYLGAMNEIIDEYGGAVIEFIGDAIFAVFGAPCYSEDHASAAVRCGIAMQAALEQLNQAWHQQGLDRLWRRNGIERLSARIGIHCGPVVVGNLGSQKRMKYSVIGDTVNIAARLEALNKELNTDILISQDVYVQLPETICRATHNQGSLQVKGRETPITVHAVTWSSHESGSLPASPA
jgi:adenylate cyclase